MTTALRPDDLGLNSVITNLPQQATLGGLPLEDIAINSVDLTLSDDFVFNPTSCGTKEATFIARSWAMDPEDPSVTGTASFDTDGCENEAYAPTASLKVDTGASFTSPEFPTVTTVVEQGAGEANTQDVVLTLPPGIGPNAPVALAPPCPSADFANGTCPASTQVGSVAAESPLLASPLSGNVFLVQGGQLPDVGIDLHGDLNIQLRATAALVGPQNRVQSTLSGLPDLPLSKFTLTFSGGSDGLFGALPEVCYPSARVEGVFDSHGGQHVTTSEKPTVTRCPSTGGGKGGKKKRRCGNRRVTKAGGPGANKLRGTRGRDVIAGLGGNDVIRGLGGNDIICGGRGQDRLIGGPGADRLIGGKGPDLLFGGAGIDVLIGGRGRDRPVQ